MSVRILAIDPGPEESGWVIFEPSTRKLFGAVSPTKLMPYIVEEHVECDVAIEMIASYGMPVGREVFDTCVWVGRLMQAHYNPDAVQLVYRKDVKLHLCGSVKTKDANIRQALIDRLGPQGTKRNPGPTYGVKSHAWAALAVAVYVADTMQGEGMQA